MNIFFDLDGTLTDAAPGITRSIEYALEKLGEPVPDAALLRGCLGPPLAESVPQLLAHPTGERIQQAITYYRERYSAVGKFENEVYAGIPETLAALNTAGHRLFVATAKLTGYGREIIEHFQLAAHFDDIFGSELDGRHSNKAELLGYMIEVNHFDRQQCLMVGDRKHDIVAAQAQQMRSVGVLYGYGSREELLTAGATYLVETPQALIPLIARL